VSHKNKENDQETGPENIGKMDYKNIWLTKKRDKRIA
jgi:hypothetical protein